MNDRKVLISTDPGIDDCLAVILALQSKDCLNVTAINASHGNVPVERALKNVLGILEITGQEKLPAIGKGAKRALGKRAISVRSAHGWDGLGGINLPPPRLRPVVKKAALLIEESVLGGVDTIISLAPLTDLARAFDKNSNLARKIDTLFIMGGALRVPGSINGFAEFNFYGDPEAASFVLESRAPIVLVSFDVTTKAVLREEDLACFEAEKSLVSGLIEHVAGYYINFYKRYKGLDGAYMHDPLTVGLAIDESICGYEELCVGVDCKRDIGRLVLKNGRPNVRFANSVDSDKFLKMFLNRLCASLRGTV